MEKQIPNKLKKDPSLSDDLLSSYSCSKFEKCSFEKNAFKDALEGYNSQTKFSSFFQIFQVTWKLQSQFDETASFLPRHTFFSGVSFWKNFP